MPKTQEDSSSNIVRQSFANGYSVIQLTDTSEYLQYLNDLDSTSNKEILSVSYERVRTPFNTLESHYIITYKTINPYSKSNIHYKYSQYETENPEEFSKYVSNFPKDYEIFDISTSSITSDSNIKKQYVITFRHQL